MAEGIGWVMQLKQEGMGCVGRELEEGGQGEHEQEDGWMLQLL